MNSIVEAQRTYFSNNWAGTGSFRCYWINTWKENPDIKEAKFIEDFRKYNKTVAEQQEARLWDEKLRNNV